MKRKTGWVLLAGMLLLAGIGISCSDSGEDTAPVENKLRVEPSEALHFKAQANEDVVLTVTTDADSWGCTAPEWVLTEQNGNRLTVNVRDNASGEVRTGELKFTAGNAEPVTIGIAQTIPEEEDDNVLEVSPMDPIVFKASGNEAVVLTVSTDAEEGWTFTAPEWLTAEKSEDGKTLTVNATDNEMEEERSGEIVFSAGTAEPVKIAVKQEKPVPDRPDVHMTSMSGMNLVELTDVERSKAYQAGVNVYLDQAPEREYTARVFVDEGYLDAFNSEHGKNCKLFPAELVKFDFAADGTLKFTPGDYQFWSRMITIDVTSSSLEAGVPYLISFYIESASDEFEITESCRVNYVLTLKEKEEIPTYDKTMRNIVFIETNDTNPLNALEFKLEDGTPFFDAVVLFSANIRYDSDSDDVYLHLNASCMELLVNKEYFLQPLRDAGMKVYLGLLGDHTPAGLANLSEAGARKYAEEVAQAVKQYELDGVNLDDEYTELSGNIESEWLEKKESTRAAARLAYELKKAMKEIVPWETDVCVFKYGYLSYIGEQHTFDGQYPGDYVDLLVPNYNAHFPTPFFGMDKKDCAGFSVELSKTSPIVSTDNAHYIKDDGYGWCQWFNLNPLRNFDKMFDYANVVSPVWYGQKTVEPEYYYKKGDNQRYRYSGK